MKTIDMKAARSVVQVQAQARPSEGTQGATGGGLTGGSGEVISAPNPQVSAQKPRHKLTTN